MRLHVNGKDIEKQKIYIGFEGEKNYTEIEFDFSDVFSKYPEASAYMNIKPYKGEIYPHTLTREGTNLLVWNVNEADCTVPGVGMYQITFTYNNTVIKSFKGICVVRDSIIGSADPPTPVEEWIEDASAALAALENITASAENLPEGSEATAEIRTVNGHKDIHIGVPAGEKGDQGFSPVVTVTDVPGGHQVVIEDESGEHTFTVMNGEDGDDGVSPQVTVTNITGGHRVSVTDASGTDTFDVMDGQDGQDGVTPDFSIGTVQTLPAGSDATASVTGTAENPVLNLGIPQGEQGDPGEIPQETLDQIEQDISDLNSALKDKADIIVSSASGAIASFPDGAESTAKELVVNIEPVQDLHGYDAPWVGGAGKNLFDISGFETVTNKGITVTQNNDGSVSVSGTATARATISLGNITISGTVILTGCPAGGSQSGYSMDIRRNGSTISGSSDTGSGSSAVAVEPDDTIFLRVENGYAFASTLVFRPMIRLSTVSDATWEPYSNLCPITGWDGVEITQKNLPIVFDSVGAVADTDYVNGKAYDVNTGAINTTQGYMIYTAYVKCIPGETYYLSGNKSATQSRGVYVSYYDANKNFLSSANPIENTSSTGIIRGSFTVPAGVAYMRFTTPTLVADTFFVSDGVEIPADYVYAGQTYHISFPSQAGTVYGGTLTINRDGSGSLVVDTISESISVDNTWTDGGSSKFYKTNALSKRNTEGADVFAISDMYQLAGNGATNLADMTTDNRFYMKGDSKRLLIRDDGYATLSDFATAMTGKSIQVVYKVAITVPYTLTANQVHTLLGYNSIWADAGQVTVTYPADTKLYIDNKLAELVAQIVNS